MITTGQLKELFMEVGEEFGDKAKVVNIIIQDEILTLWVDSEEYGKCTMVFHKTDIDNTKPKLSLVHG